MSRLESFLFAVVIVGGSLLIGFQIGTEKAKAQYAAFTTLQIERSTKGNKQ